MNRSHRYCLLLVALSAAGVLLCGSPAATADSVSTKTDSFLARTVAVAPRHGWSRVIARFDAPLTGARRARLMALGASVYRSLPIIRSAAVAVPSRNLRALAALPFVAHLSADTDVRKCDEFTVGHSGADTAFAQSGLTGKGVGVAVIDSGILDQPDLDTPNIGGASGCRIVANVNYVPNTKSTTDTCGHGTHIAGIIAGNGTASTGAQFFHTFYGIARQTSLINVRVLDGTGKGVVSQVISGIQWAVANRVMYNIKVLNLSLGHPVGDSYVNDPLCQAVEAAWKAGITVVCAAGNGGRLNSSSMAGIDNEGWGTAYGSIQSPGNDPYVITVGAMKSLDGARADDRVATYSSRGPSRIDLVLKPDVMAPGNRVISTSASSSYLYTSFPATNLVAWQEYSTTVTAGGFSNKYFRLSGTSMASPVVAGAVALMLQKSPSLTPNTIKARLMISADKWADPTGAADPCTYGAGYLNIPAALACTAVPNQAATSPSMSEDTNGNVYINMDRAVWGTDSGGLGAVWGVTGVNSLRAVWGSTAILGSSTNILNASRAVWGAAVWSDRAVWRTTTGAADLSTTASQGE